MMGRSDFEKDERHTLYLEYLRIIADHRPPVFVMENVKGLLSATIEGKSAIARIYVIFPVRIPLFLPLRAI